MWSRLHCLVAGLFAAAIAGAAPFVPASDKQVLERLPNKGGDLQQRELRALRDQLANQPANLLIVLKLARRYIDMGRASGDPRYSGYAEAVLAPWFALASPPVDVLVMRATLRQRMHKFDAALADLDRVLQQNPLQAQARLTKATILQVQGRFAAAGEQCAELQALTQELIWAHCLANVQAATGTLRDSYTALNAVLERSRNVPADLRAWVATTLAEMATRLGTIADADKHFRAALALDPADQYLLAAYSDFLLDNQRPREVIALLKDQTRVDPLLLRYALALKATRSPEAQRQIDALATRFDASRLRGRQCAPARRSALCPAIARRCKARPQARAGKLGDTKRTGRRAHPARSRHRRARHKRRSRVTRLARSQQIRRCDAHQANRPFAIASKLALRPYM